MPATIFIIICLMLLIHWLTFGGPTSLLLPFSHSISSHEIPKWETNPQHLYLTSLLCEKTAWSGTGKWHHGHCLLAGQQAALAPGELGQGGVSEKG